MLWSALAVCICSASMELYAPAKITHKNFLDCPYSFLPGKCNCYNYICRFFMQEANPALQDPLPVAGRLRYHLFLHHNAHYWHKKTRKLTSWFRRAIDGARTRGLDLGKVARYQLRHYRISGWWESNPRIQLGRLVFYHWTTPAHLCLSVTTKLSISDVCNFVNNLFEIF